MLSLGTAHTHFLLLPHSFSNLSPHSSSLLHFQVKPRMKQERFFSVSLVSFKEAAGEGGSFLGFTRKDCYLGCGFLMCKRDWEGEGDMALEAEILEFMKGSGNPKAFPTKKELIEAGRMDLVEGILREGGWLASGWDLDEEENKEEKEEDEVVGLGNSNGASFGGLKKTNGCDNGVIGGEGNEQERFEGSIFSFDSQPSASSSGRSLERTDEDDSGIEGILTRLEKERNFSFGVGLKPKGGSIHTQSSGLMPDWLSKTSNDTTVAALKRNTGSVPTKTKDSTVTDWMGKQDPRKSPLGIDDFSKSHKPDTWRAWSIQRAGFSDMEFEAGDISYDEIGTGDKIYASRDQGLQERGFASPSLNPLKENSSPDSISYTDIRSRLQHLEVELSSVLNTLKSRSGENLSKNDCERSSEDLLKLFDAWEFQQNEIMSAQDRLRSIRAKLAVLEGKMALAIIDAQKMVEVKQKRIDNAHRASRLLPTACIVWPNSASEVLLAGSFDGWVTQRKMEKSRTGIFSLYLKLYPGRYEIKFIVDGEWKIDPLRPIVHNNGYENNLLIIT